MVNKVAAGGKPQKKQDKPKKDTKPQKNTPKKKGARETFWTDSRVERLIKWHEKLQGKPKMYEKIAEKLSSTRHAVYKKLGRLGRIDAKWTKNISKNA